MQFLKYMAKYIKGMKKNSYMDFPKPDLGLNIPNSTDPWPRLHKGRKIPGLNLLHGSIQKGS